MAEKKDSKDKAEAVVDERVRKGFAPPNDPGDPRPREEQEADARGDDPMHPGLNAASEEQKAVIEAPRETVVAKSSAQEAAEMDAMRRDPRSMGGAEEREVRVNGVRFVVPTGKEFEAPGPVADVIKNSDQMVRTHQMAGGATEPTVDLTKE